MNIESFKIFINRLADMSGEYIAKNFGRRIDIDYKADASPVTAIDKNTEEMLRREIEKKFPDHGIIGEEWGNKNPDAEFVWIIDPIDGTKSFITGVPLFGTLIGLACGGEPILGLIDQPVLKERIVGDCRECLFNGSPVRAAKNTELDGITLLSSDFRYCEKARKANWRELENRAAIARTWGDCYGYMLVCRGLAHIMADATLEIWDAAALIPALRGAGVSYSDWKGGTNIGNVDGLIAACTPELHKKALELLNR